MLAVTRRRWAANVGSSASLGSCRAVIDFQMAYAWRSAGRGINFGSLVMSGLVRLTFHVTIAAGIWRELARQDCQIDREDFVAWVIPGSDAIRQRKSNAVLDSKHLHGRIRHDFCDGARQ